MSVNVKAAYQSKAKLSNPSHSAQKAGHLWLSSESQANDISSLLTLLDLFSVQMYF